MNEIRNVSIQFKLLSGIFLSKNIINNILINGWYENSSNQIWNIDNNSNLIICQTIDEEKNIGNKFQEIIPT